MQSLFLGDTTCGDEPDACVFADVVSEHRYLHVVVHDEPRTYDWQVRAGTGCSDLRHVVGGEALSASGYLERVVDLEALQPALDHVPACFEFAGDEGFTNTYYTAYFDDSPAPDADVLYPHYQDVNGRPYLPDLDIAYIHRSPSYSFDGRPNGPAPGQLVHFDAHLVNSGLLPVAPFGYTWFLDGRPVKSARFDGTMAPGEPAILTFSWRWEDRPHTLTLSVQPEAPEISTGNDRLSIRTDALALGFWVERTAYNYFRDHQWTYCRPYGCAGSDSLEDWLQRQVASWNGLLAGADDPDVAPAGVADRIHLDELTVVPDGALPLHGWSPTNAPDLADHTVDLEWGMPATAVAHGYHLLEDGPFDVEWSMLHELGHARYLADYYRFDFSPSAAGTLRVTAADGKPAFDAANPFDPARPLRAFSGSDHQVFLYLNHEQDMMSCDCNHFYSTYSAVVLNRIRNRRARCGNVNPPCNLGEWYVEMPPVNRLRILDPSSLPVPNGTEVRLYFDTDQTYNGHSFDDTRSQTVTTVGSVAQLAPDPFRTAGSPWPPGHHLLLIEVRTPSLDRFCFAEPADFNMAYWYGYRDTSHPAVYTLRLADVSDNACHLSLPAIRVNEPFATSPYNSQVLLGRPHLAGQRQVRDLGVTLRDDGTPPNAMRNRLLVARSTAGKRLTSGTTDRTGVVRLSVPPRGSIQVVDVTDNNLPITSRAVAPLRAPGRRP